MKIATKRQLSQHWEVPGYRKHSAITDTIKAITLGLILSAPFIWEIVKCLISK